MSHALRAPSVSQGLSELAEEFRRLDRERRGHGLSLADATRYHSLFERLSDFLASGERHRRADARQFLRISFQCELMLLRAHGRVAVRCRDFGGGGCAVRADEREPIAVGDDLWFDGVVIEGVSEPLRGRARVVWSRDGVHGLRFALDTPEERDQIDRLFYRLLDRFLGQ